VETENGLLLPVQAEAIFNHHPDVARTAVVGIGEWGAQRPVLIVEPVPSRWPKTRAAREAFTGEMLALGAESEITHEIVDVLYHRDLPVDVRHNAKIQREKLALWAAEELSPVRKLM
jgi:acyl-coenzyme A synthetase/AMP-(fatty) acid ligase